MVSLQSTSVNCLLGAIDLIWRDLQRFTFKLSGSNIQAVNDSVRFGDMRDSTEESRLNTALTPILYAGLTTK